MKKKTWFWLAILLVVVLLSVFVVYLTNSGDGDDRKNAGGDQQTERVTKTIVDELNREVEIQVPARTAATFMISNAEYVRAIAGAEVLTGIDSSSLDSPNYDNYWNDLRDDIVLFEQKDDFEKIATSGAEVLIVPRNWPWQDYEKSLLHSVSRLLF